MTTDILFSATNIYYIQFNMIYDKVKLQILEFEKLKSKNIIKPLMDYHNNRPFNFD